ncbi:hypothetical protein JNW88_25020 [Micromonospora sp. ATA32]|nr:hypothetical protein [Micromonospora sp. ATA32]
MLGLVVLLVGATPDGRPVLPVAAIGCALVAALLWWPVARAGRIAERFTLVPVAAAPLLAGVIVTAVVAEAGGRAGPAVAFCLIAALLTTLIAFRPHLRR